MAAIWNPNMSQFRQLDVGAAIQTGQNIQYNRMRNEALGLEMQEKRDALQARQEAQEIRAMYDGMPAQIEALEEANMFEQADQLRNQYIQARKSEAEITEAMREGIDETNYKQVRQDLIQAGAIMPDMWPVEYSEDWWRDQVEQKRGNLQRITRRWHEGGATLSQDIVAQDGGILWEGEPYYADGGPGTGEDFEFKAADANQIGNQVERIFGGFYDPQTGQLRGLDPDQAARVQSVQEEAERIYAENQGVIPHGVAVTRAARRLGINIENWRNTAATDPWNIRDNQD